MTGAETCELVLALDATGDTGRAAGAVRRRCSTCATTDGVYWTGWQFADGAHCPAERSSWTAAAVILAADALSGTTGGSGLFREVAPRR